MEVVLRREAGGEGGLEASSFQPLGLGQISFGLRSLSEKSVSLSLSISNMNIIILSFIKSQINYEAVSYYYKKDTNYGLYDYPSNKLFSKSNISV